jgi:hypothetical protein
MYYSINIINANKSRTLRLAEYVVGIGCEKCIKRFVGKPKGMGSVGR